MIINRHNYEEFFLLYIDKELAAEGRAAVERFVSQNPDLAKELEMLQQATLADDNIQFAQKELLYKEEKSISIDNYEEYFLLFADNELNNQQTAEVENFVLKHPELQNEFTILQKTRLQPEIIAFAGKEKLYRNERKVRRIVPVAFIRMGAAAAIIGIAYISFLIINPDNNIHKDVVVIPEKPATELSIKENTVAAKKPVTENTLASVKTEKENGNKAKSVAADNARLKKQDKRKVREIKNQQEPVVVHAVKPENKIQIAEQLVVNEETSAKKPDVAKVSIEKRNINDKNNSNLIKWDKKNTLMINEPIVKEDKPLVAHAVYLETDNAEEEKSVYVGSAALNKNKVKGLFKKAAVFFEKKIRGNEE